MYNDHTITTCTCCLYLYVLDILVLLRLPQLRTACMLLLLVHAAAIFVPLLIFCCCYLKQWNLMSLCVDCHYLNTFICCDPIYFNLTLTYTSIDIMKCNNTGTQEQVLSHPSPPPSSNLTDNLSFKCPFSS